MSLKFYALFILNVFCSVFLTIKKWVECISSVLFTHSIKNIKDASDRNGEKNVTCEQAFTVFTRTIFVPFLSAESLIFLTHFNVVNSTIGIHSSHF